MSTITAKDLTKEFPRSPYDTLAGVPWLPRLIDKVRALNAGKIGEYTPYPCGGDRAFLGAAGLDADALRAQIDAGKTDDEIAAWVKAQLPADVEQRLAGYRQGMHQPVSGEMAEYLAGSKAELAKARPDLDQSKIINFATLICVEEGHPIPQA
jgi:hypothetical protein